MDFDFYFRDVKPVSVKNNEILDEVFKCMIRFDGSKFQVSKTTTIITLKSGEKIGLRILSSEDKEVLMFQCKLHTHTQNGLSRLVECNRRGVVLKC